MNAIWEAIVRFRNWIVTVAGAVMILVPELLAAPEVLAVIPTSYHKWIFVATLGLNLAMRWRPASMAKDPEIQVAKAVAGAGGPTTITVKEVGVAEPIKTVKTK